MSERVSNLKPCEVQHRQQSAYNRGVCVAVCLASGRAGCRPPNKMVHEQQYVSAPSLSLIISKAIRRRSRFHFTFITLLTPKRRTRVQNVCVRNRCCTSGIKTLILMTLFVTCKNLKNTNQSHFKDHFCPRRK